MTERQIIAMMTERQIMLKCVRCKTEYESGLEGSTPKQCPKCALYTRTMQYYYSRKLETPNAISKKERRANVIQMWLAGSSCNKIVNACKMKENTVYRWVSKSSVYGPPNPPSETTRLAPPFERVAVDVRGNVWTIHKKGLFWHQVGQWDQNGGYIRVNIPSSKDRKSHTKTVHRLVLETFDPPPSTKGVLCALHKDGNLQNNSLENLRWVSRKELVAVRHSNGHSSGRKLSKEIAMKVRKALQEGASVSDLAKRYDVGRLSIYKIKRGQSYSVE